MQKLQRPADIGFSPTIPNLLRNAVETFGNREFLVEDARTLSYAEVDEASSMVARALLALGSGKAARVGLLIPNGVDWVVCWLGAARAGALTQPMSTLYKPAELEYCLGQLDVETLFVSARYGNIDLLDRLDQALPHLRDQASTTLRLPSHPYLQRIVVLGETDRAWAIKGLDSLRSIASTEPRIDDAFLRQVEDRIVPADLLVTISTSGTTAHPKAVVHTHGTAVRVPHEFLEYIDFQPAERNLASMPLFWVGGLNCNLIPALHVGGTLIFPRGPKTPEVLDAIRKHRPTRVPGWEAQREQLMREALANHVDISCIRGGLNAYLDEQNREIPINLRAGAFGMTESFGMHTLERRRAALPRSKAGSLGRQLAGIQRRIVDLETGQDVAPGNAGELLLRGYSLMAGYYKVEREDTFYADSFFPTGDVCSIDEDGYLSFHTRRTEMIKTAGANVAPLEVERVLRLHADVTDAYVFGLPDPVRGEAVVAVVTAASGNDLDIAALQQLAAENLSSYKVPRSIVQFAISEIPMTASNKVSKAELAKLFIDREGVTDL